MKQMQNQRNDAGITLVALIITIIILVILAAVSISAVYNSKIVDYAVNGATDYAGEAVKENEIMSGTESLIDSTVKKIEDILGGKTPSEPTPGPQKGLTEEQLKEKIGTYVAYTPDTAENATYSTTQDGAERSGNGEQTISKVNDLKWRIMNAEGNKVTLISETIPTGNITLKGADGYNNGVKLLNDACNSLYKNTTLGATGRSMFVEDINGLMGVTPSTSLNSSYGTEYTPNYIWYPNIFADEKAGYVNDKYGTMLGTSDQSIWYSGSTTASTLKGKYTFYSYKLSTYKATNTAQYALATGQAGNTGSILHNAYWIASRCVYYYSNHFYFRLFCVGNDYVDAGYNLYSSDNVAGSFSLAIRPCIEIDLLKANVGETGSGESTDPYSIAAR